MFYQQDTLSVCHEAVLREDRRSAFSARVNCGAPHSTLAARGPGGTGGLTYIHKYDEEYKKLKNSSCTISHFTISHFTLSWVIVGCCLLLLCLRLLSVISHNELEDRDAIVIFTGLARRQHQLLEGFYSAAFVCVSKN